MRVLIATDAWYPQVNGVVQTLTSVGQALERMGVEVRFLTPEGIPSVPLPTYPDIRLALASARTITRRIDEVAPDIIHIATEGPIGHLVRRHCLKRQRGFTTSFHTRFADYAAARLPIPKSWSWSWLRWFHNAGRVTMASTDSLSKELMARGFRKLMRWPRGVDTNLFQPRSGSDLGLPRPVFLTVGRVAVEKNVEAFLALDLPGSKVVVGDGPARQDLARRYPSAVFLGTKKGQELAEIYASADVFVFPSRTDTFGLVLLEALASGLPIAGFPVDSTRDVVGNAPVAVLDEDLRAACLRSLAVSRTACRAYAKTMTWDESARCFLGNLKNSGALLVKHEPVSTLLSA
ncbi:MAG TPA: glycosyltransferase family 1 protein [Xanthobacteraceae bacterium]